MKTAGAFGAERRCLLATLTESKVRGDDWEAQELNSGLKSRPAETGSGEGDGREPDSEISTMTRSCIRFTGMSTREGGVQMLKSEKEVLIKDLSDKFTRAKGVIVAEFNKLDVDTVNQLRRKLRDGERSNGRC